MCARRGPGAVCALRVGGAAPVTPCCRSRPQLLRHARARRGGRVCRPHCLPAGLAGAEKVVPEPCANCPWISVALRLVVTAVGASVARGGGCANVRRAGPERLVQCECPPRPSCAPRPVPPPLPASPTPHVPLPPGVSVRRRRSVLLDAASRVSKPPLLLSFCSLGVDMKL